MRIWLGFLGAGIAAYLCGCGSVNNTGDDAATPAIDAATDTIDAGDTTPDAGQTAGSPDHREVAPAGGRVSGGGYTLDVQLGHSVQQQPATGGGTTVEGAAAVKP